VKDATESRSALRALGVNALTLKWVTAISNRVCEPTGTRVRVSA
jgi:hypothetical protein